MCTEKSYLSSPLATEKHSLTQHAKDYWKKLGKLKLKELSDPLTKQEDFPLFQEEKVAEKVDFYHF